MTSAASDWRLQIEQITVRGAAFLWVNDPTWYTRDIHHAQRLPDFNFIVLDRLDPVAIIAAYGAPDGQFSCGRSEIWTYADPAHLHANLTRLSPQLIGYPPPLRQLQRN